MGHEVALEPTSAVDGRFEVDVEDLDGAEGRFEFHDPPAKPIVVRRNPGDFFGRIFREERVAAGGAGFGGTEINVREILREVVADRFFEWIAFLQADDVGVDLAEGFNKRGRAIAEIDVVGRDAEGWGRWNFGAAGCGTAKKEKEKRDETKGGAKEFHGPAVERILAEGFRNILRLFSRD